MTVTDHDIEFAEAKLRPANDVLVAAQRRVTDFAAEHLKLELRRFFETHPCAKRVSYEVNYESDDEGGTMEIVDLYADIDDSVELADDEGDPMEDIGDIRVWSIPAVEQVFGVEGGFGGVYLEPHELEDTNTQERK